MLVNTHANDNSISKQNTNELGCQSKMVVHYQNICTKRNLNIRFELTAFRFANDVQLAEHNGKRIEIRYTKSNQCANAESFAK